jgi:hypothetical protein
VQLLREVVLDADLADGFELGLEPVGVLLLVDEHVGEQLAAAVVTDPDARGDAVVQPLDRFPLRLQVELELLGHRLSYPHRVQALEVRHALEVEDPIGERLDVLHLVDRFGADLVRQALVAPVVAQLGVHEVLVDGRELGGEHVVQQFQDGGVTLHPATLYVVLPSGGHRQADACPGDDRLHDRQAAPAAGGGATPLLNLLDTARAGFDLGQDSAIGHQAAVANQRHRL